MCVFPDKSMKFFSKVAISLAPGGVVGVVSGPKALGMALKMPRGAVDFLELRVDAWSAAGGLDRLEKALPRLQAPLILTVRHPLEGGEGKLAHAQRRVLFRRFLPYASLLDVELRSAAAMREVLEEARSAGMGVILSHHDFLATPSSARLETLLRNAAGEGVAVFKLATRADAASDLAVLLRFLTARRRSPVPALAVMGMGRFGKVSRLTLGDAGSVLNYGYLDAPQVSGQWPAALLKKRLLELPQ